MQEDRRIWAVKDILFDYVKSPSLRHVRDGHSVSKLAQQIVKQIDLADSIWRKWDGQREVLLKSAVGCWIPIEDLREFLNQMPGPTLTLADVSQRLKAFEDEEHHAFANENFQSGCLTIYEREKSLGTELAAIIGVLRDYIENEEERIRHERQAEYEMRRQEEKVALEQRLLSGGDCKWTQLSNSPNWHCRTNGRTYRLSPTNDKKWKLHRVSTVSDERAANLIGIYSRRGDATKVVREIAYKPEPKF